MTFNLEPSSFGMAISGFSTLPSVALVIASPRALQPAPRPPARPTSPGTRRLLVRGKHRESARIIVRTRSPKTGGVRARAARSGVACLPSQASTSGATKRSLRSGEQLLEHPSVCGCPLHVDTSLSLRAQGAVVPRQPGQIGQIDPLLTLLLVHKSRSCPHGILAKLGTFENAGQLFFLVDSKVSPQVVYQMRFHSQ